MRNCKLTLLLCLVLMVGVQAGPIGYQQIDQQAQQKTNNGNNAPAQPTGGESNPEIVRLADGRIVPFGAGVICSDNCVGADAIDAPFDLGKIAGVRGINPWLIGVPVAVGGIAAIVLLSGGNTTTPAVITTDVTTLPIIIAPRDPIVPAPVPEPATVALMGVGLAMLAKRSRKQKQ
jgi:PEP-CTERM motif